MRQSALISGNHLHAHQGRAGPWRHNLAVSRAQDWVVVEAMPAEEGNRPRIRPHDARLRPLGRRLALEQRAHQAGACPKLLVAQPAAEQAHLDQVLPKVLALLVAQCSREPSTLEASSLATRGRLLGRQRIRSGGGESVLAIG